MKKTSIFFFISLMLISSVFAQHSYNKNKTNFKLLFKESKQINYRIIDQKSFIKNYYNNDETRRSCAVFTTHKDTADKLNNRAVFFALSPKIGYDYLPSWTISYLDSSLSYQAIHYYAFYNRAVMHGINNDFSSSVHDFEMAALGLNFYFSSILHLNRGILFCKNNKYNNTIADLNMAEDLGRNDFELYYNRGLAKYFMETYENAIIDLKKALRIEKNNAEVSLAIANAYMKLDEIERARIYYKKAWNIDKENISYSLSYGRVLLQLKKYHKAENVFLYILKTDKNNYDALIGKADALNGQKKQEEALATLQKTNKRYPKDCNVILRMGDSYFLNKKYVFANNQYKKILEIDSTNIFALRGLALSYERLYIHDSCIYYYKKLEELSSIELYNSGDLITIGNAALNINDFTIAYKLFNIIYTADSSNTHALNGLGVIYMQNNKLETALDFFYKAIKSNPNNADAYANIGQCYHYSYHYKKSINFLKKAYKRNPFNLQILNGLAMGYQCINEEEKAIKYMELALALDHDNPKLLSNMSIVYSSFSLNLKNSDTTISNDYYLLALENINAAIKKFPNEKSLYNNRGVIHLNNGNYMMAIKDFVPFNSFYHSNNTGIAHALLGNIDSANFYFEEAIQYSCRLNHIPVNNQNILHTNNYSNTKKNIKKFNKDISKYIPKNQNDIFTRIYYYYLPAVFTSDEKTSFTYNYPLIEAKTSRYVLEFMYILPQSR